jgi:hypothetical protein
MKLISSCLRFWGALTLAAVAVRADEPPAAAPVLEQRLRGEGAEALARAARAEGDPARGALVFYQPSWRLNWGLNV